MRKCLMVLCLVFFVLMSCMYAQAATSWYLPEGSTQGFDLWILVTNPNSTDATILYTFYYSDGTTTGSLTYGTATVSASGRSSLHVNSVALQTGYSDLLDKAISTKVQCLNGLNIYAERAMYWPTGTGTDDWTAGHTARGVSGTEGCFVEIENPLAFPISISSSGSYKLIENITCSTQDTSAITISADDVTLDLNGFTITGAGKAVGSSGDGIEATSTVRNITIKNGIIRDCRDDGIDMASATSITVENVTMYNNGDRGVYANIGGRVINCTAEANGFCGIEFYQNGVLIGNQCYNNAGYGIRANTSCIVKDNSIFYTDDNTGETQDSGLWIRYNNGVYNNVISSGQANVYGIYVTESRNVISDNAIVDNTAGGIYIAGDKNLVNTNHMINTGTDLTFPIGADNNVYTNNVFDAAVADAGAGNAAGTTNPLLSSVQ